MQMNTIPGSIMPYVGIVWYDFFKTPAGLGGRGTMLEVDGGSWASFTATSLLGRANPTRIATLPSGAGGREPMEVIR